MLEKCIANYITGLIMIFVQSYCFEKINGKQSTKPVKIKTFFIFLISFIPVISSLTNNIFIYGLCSLILYLLIEKSTIKREYYNNQYVIFLWAFNIILEMLLSFPLSFISINTINQLKNNLALTIVMSMLLNVIIIIIIQFKKIRELIINLNFYSRFGKRTSNILFIILFESFLLGAVIGSNYINVISKVLFSIILFMSDIAFLFFAKHLKEEINLIHINDNLLIEYTNINNELSTYKEFKHNIIHSLNGLKSISSRPVINLINNIIDSNYKIENKNVVIPLSKIEKLIYNYLYNSSEKLKIKIQNYSNIINIDNMAINAKIFAELCKSLGIALDNAREAALKSKEKIIFVEILEEANALVFEVINSFNDTICIDNLGIKTVSTKPMHYGIGLKSLSNNKYIKNKIYIKNNLFIHKLSINKKSYVIND